MSKKYELIHHKDFHRVQLQRLKVKERNIFMALSFKAMNQESNLLEFDINEIAKLINFTQQTNESIYDYLRKAYKSILNITIEINKVDGFKAFVLFPFFETFEDAGKVQFKVNEDYKYLLNNVVKPYTIQHLFEYNELLSKYSQLTYSLLKEWEGIKVKTIDIEEFKQKLGIENYRMSEIDKRVFTPIMKELPQHFYNLKIEKIKEGRKIAAIKFSWEEKKELPLLEELNKDYDERTFQENAAFNSFLNLFNNPDLNGRETIDIRCIYSKNKENPLIKDLTEKQQMTTKEYFTLHNIQ